MQLWPVWLQRGQKTTVITGPVRPDGRVDYAAALNTECSAGLTPDRNSAVLLVQALGPNIFDEKIATRYFQTLGIDPPPAEGVYLQAVEQLHPRDDESQERLNGEFEQVLMTGWAPEEHPELTHWLDINESPLERCTAASRLDRFYDPLVCPPGGSLLDVSFFLVQRSCVIPRLLALRARRHLHQGQVAEALADSETMHRLSRLIAQHPLMIPQFVAYRHSAMASAADGAIVNSGQASAEQARQHREFLLSLKPMPPIAHLFDHGERFLSLDHAQNELFSETLGIESLQPNLFLETINEGFDTVLAAMNETDTLSQRRAIEAANEELRRRTKLNTATMAWMMINPRRQFPCEIGKVYAWLSMPAADSCVRENERVRVRRQLSIAGFALAEYRAAHGQYPESLELLTPEFLEHVPIDPFNGESIHYVLDVERSAILLYSVGENGRDDHGLMSGKTKADDIAFGAAPSE